MTGLRTTVFAGTFVWAGLMFAATTGCRDGAPPAGAQGETMASVSIADLIAAHADSLLAIPGVVGVYEARLGDGTPCVKIMVIRLDAALRARLPRTIEGHPVTIEESGEIRAMPGEPR